MASGTKPKILMVDDEQFLLDMFKLALEKHGYEVMVYHDADAAIVALQRGFAPEVILFDISMPESKSGFEFIEAVHTAKLAKHAFKIAFTNSNEHGVKERVMELGADAFLAKAKFIPSELAAKVAELLEERSRKTSIAARLGL